MSQGIYASCAAALDALQNGPGDFACHDYDTVREIVMCDAWHRRTADPVTPKDFSAAVKDAWTQVRQACAPVGGIEHEVNTPVERADGDVTLDQQGAIGPTVIQTWDILDPSGHNVGEVVVEEDGAITTCIHDHCHTDFHAANPGSREAILAAIRDIYPTVGYHLRPEATA